ncbi:MAG: glycosyltransferase family 4 protein [Cytophagia bacterium]|nr:glycosyltransferase family 4 protein [Cytophagia bacterium]
MKRNRALKILLISKTLPWQFKGGIQTHTWELAKSLVAIGHQVSILNGGPYRSKTNTNKIEGIQVIQTPYFPGRYLKPISLIAEEFSFNWAVLKWIKKNHRSFDIIHAQGRSGYLLSFNSQIRSRLVNTVHGLIDIENQDKKWYQLNYSLHHSFTKRIEDKLFKSASGLVAVSNALKDELLGKRVIQKPIQVISNGVNSFEAPRVISNSNQSRFLFIGRLHPIKGIAELVEKMDMANDTVFLDIIGNGPEKGKIEKLIALKGLQNRVRLLGEYSNDKIHSVLPYYTALVLPSKYETQGIVLLEANSEGIPVIASDIPAIRETVSQGENGLLCSKDRPEEFVIAMNYLARAPHDCKVMGQKGKSKVAAHYTWQRIAEQTESFYYTIAQ